MTNGKTLLFNPTSIVHDRSIEIFRKSLPGWEMKRIYNPHQPWFPKKKNEGGVSYFSSGYFQRLPIGVLDRVSAVIMFTAQSRVPPANIIEEASLRAIPVIAIEEVYMMMLENGYVNNYTLPVDHLFAASEYEKQRFVEMGVHQESIDVTGCVFRCRKDLVYNDIGDGATIRREFGLSGDKLIATLSLSFLSPGGETPAIRRKLLEILSKGLPAEYELLVKPHPSEQGAKFNNFVKRYAPSAVTVDQNIPIDKVLDVTDILFNRGNSQVIVDAIQRGIPAVAIPVGRRTFFHDMLSELIVHDSEDLPRILGILKDRGMGIYGAIFNKYLPIKPEESLDRTMRRIVEITEKRLLYDPEVRLLELALYWAWMGYPKQGLATLSKIAPESGHGPLAIRLRRLIEGTADRDDIVFLKRWSDKTYKNWVVCSLWIKTQYNKGAMIGLADREWFSQYPPKINTAHFIPYANLLRDLYIRSGLKSEADAIVNKLFELGFEEVSRVKARLGYIKYFILKDLARIARI